MLKKLLVFSVQCMFISYILVAAALYCFQEKLIFLPARLESGYRFDLRSPFEEINLAADGAVLNGLRIHAQKPKGALLFFHGNAGTLQDWSPVAERFAALGYETYLFNYRGYGKSTGRISSEAVLFDDADKAVEYVRNDFGGKPEVVAGYSMGSGLAARAARQYGIRKLALFAPYFKLDDFLHEKVVWMPKFLIRYRIPTADFIAAAKQSEITLLHGRQDALIGVENMHKLSKLLKKQDKAFELEADHNTIMLKPELWQILQNRL
ncbi:alpha/beta hydrolase [Neisseria canis]|uniref:2-succinyl-6-hydroxy-2,4-cyclohexadiene-1-carboxy late synthase n=1 Tax=Neisseria canis TaxID=493 RepID=A0A448D7D6_9NEIS|nr:alpha/beta fold hydrolase [Neisseria canis]VEF00589.1 2-succinyl-6-hydroxy-2,4-cyclohexadiene-1-carboxylate synthase [Neisseria canis]